MSSERDIRFNQWQRAGVWDRLHDALVRQQALSQVSGRLRSPRAEWIS